MPTAYITHDDCLLHDMVEEHPESPARLRAINDRLTASGLLDYLRYYEAPRCGRRELARVHDKSYLKWLRDTAPAEGLVHVDPDTYMTPHTMDAAARAAGATVLATDLVVKREVDNAFCAVRPPGHHAERGEAMGFCFYNNVAVGAAHALEHYGLQRVAILDFDVHHGNGTEDIFRTDDRVMVCSAYQHPLYPYTEIESAPGHNVHAPLPSSSTGKDFRDAVSQRWFPAIEQFRPQMIFLSAGFDAHHEEEYADLHLHESDYGWLTERVLEYAERYAQKRVVSVLEGGYALHALARSVHAHLRVMMGL